MELSQVNLVRIWGWDIDRSSFPQNTSRLDSDKWGIDIVHSAILVFISLNIWSLLGKVEYIDF